MAFAEKPSRGFLDLCRRIFFFDLGLSIYFFLFNLFLMGRGYSEPQLGILTGAIATGNLMGAMFAAGLIGRAGLRKALMICQSIAPVLLCARIFAASSAVQIGLSIAAGMCLSLWATCVSPSVAALVEERRRPFAFSLLFSMGIGVCALGGLVASRLPGLFLSLSGVSRRPEQWTLIAACSIAVLGVLPSAALPAMHDSSPARAQPRFSAAIQRLLPAVAVWGMVNGAFTPFTSVLLSSHFGMTLRDAGTVFSISQLCQVGGVLCAPILFRRVGIASSIFATQAATGICFILLAIGAGPFGASIAFVVLTGVQWMSEPGIYALSMSLVPGEHRAGAAASMTLVLSAMQMVAGGAAGWAFAHWGYPFTLRVIGLVAILAGILFKRVVSNREATQDMEVARMPAD